MLNSFQNRSAEDQFGARLAQRLSAAAPLSQDISERLRFARQRALKQRKITSGTTLLSNGQSSFALGTDYLTFWQRFSIAMPLIVLVLGLIFINITQEDDRLQELATVDLAILTDDLPPQAYIDRGFAQYLKSHNPAQDKDAY